MEQFMNQPQASKKTKSRSYTCRKGFFKHSWSLDTDHLEDFVFLFGDRGPLSLSFSVFKGETLSSCGLGFVLMRCKHALLENVLACFILKKASQDEHQAFSFL